MGKIKGRRQRGNRYNPMGVESAPSNGVEDQPSSGNSKAGLRNLAEKISSHLVEERITGLNTLAALALEPSNPDIIVEAGMVTKIAPLLKDVSVLVRLAAAGALRNVSAGGSDEVVESMVQEDVMMHLASLLREYKEPWTPNTAQNNAIDTAREDNVDPQASVFIHSTYLLLNLCECSEEAINVLNREGLVQELLLHLTWFPPKQPVARVGSQSNKNGNSMAANYLKKCSSFYWIFTTSHISKPKIFFFFTKIGILYNIGYCSSGGNNFQLIVQVISVALESDVLALVTEYCSAINSQAALPMAADDLEHLITAQQLALEMLSNICCTDDEEEFEDDVDDMEDEGESMEVGGNGSHVTPAVELPPEVVEGLVHFKLLDKVLNKVHYPNDQLCTSLNDVKHGNQLLTKLGVLRIRALLSLQNMVSCLELKDMGGSDLMYSTWTNIGNLVFKKPCTDITLLEASTGAMRAIIDSLSKSRCDQLAGLSHTDLQVRFIPQIWFTLITVLIDFPKMLSDLGWFFVSSHRQIMFLHDLLRKLSTVAEYLLRVASHDEELWVSAEALDVLIDLYSDDKTDQLAHNTHLVDRFKGIQPQFKAKYQQRKKKLGEHRALVLTVRDNLVSFTKYKGGRVKNLANKKSKAK
ncbi:unnamed protein product, partial [Meganyctiphanes norvegica]